MKKQILFLISLIVLTIAWPLTLYAETSVVINVCLAVITFITWVIITKPILNETFKMKILKHSICLIFIGVLFFIDYFQTSILSSGLTTVNTYNFIISILFFNVFQVILSYIFNSEMVKNLFENQTLALIIISILTMLISVGIGLIIPTLFNDNNSFYVFKSYFMTLFTGVVYFHCIYRVYTLFDFKEEKIGIITSSIFLAIPMSYMIVSFGYIAFGLQNNIKLMDNQVSKLSVEYLSYTTPEQYETSLAEIYSNLIKFNDKDVVTLESSYGYVKMSYLFQFPMRVYNKTITEDTYNTWSKKEKITELKKICEFIVRLNSSGLTDNLKQEKNVVVASLVEYMLFCLFFFIIHTNLMKKITLE